MLFRSRVVNFFRANETVYMVMQYERGKSLQDYILGQDALVSEKFIRRVFAELSNGLREVHTQKLLHLDIKPANIYIRLDGSPVLLDFGSARQALTENQAKIAPSYTPGFASPEQYYDRKQLGTLSNHSIEIISSIHPTSRHHPSPRHPFHLDQTSRTDSLFHRD